MKIVVRPGIKSKGGESISFGKLGIANRTIACHPERSDGSYINPVATFFPILNFRLFAKRFIQSARELLQNKRCRRAQNHIA